MISLTRKIIKITKNGKRVEYMWKMLKSRRKFTVILLKQERRYQLCASLCILNHQDYVKGRSSRNDDGNVDDVDD